MPDREPIQMTDSIMDALVAMSEGNPGAATVLGELTKDERGLACVLHLDDMNMRGPQIWVAYKDHCGQDIERLIECIIARDQAMIDTVNAECYQPQLNREEYAHQAIPSGASFKGEGAPA